MERRLLRNLPALTEAECEKLKSSRVFICGCGGLGGYLSELVVRAGVGKVRAADPDVFDETNLNRQLLATRESLGRNKALCAMERARLIAPETEYEALAVRLDESNADGLLAGCDIVLDGLDSARSRRTLSAACARLGLPLVLGAVDGWLCHAALSMPGDGLTERLYPAGTADADAAAAPVGTLSFCPALCASVQVALCVAYLCGRDVESGRLCCFDLLGQRHEGFRLA